QHREHQIAAQQRRQREADGPGDHRRNQVPAALAVFIATAPHQQHRDDGAHVRQAGQQADVQRVGHPGVAYQRGQPEGDCVLAHDHAEIDAGQ
nr:hypothetical protein [Tanacetum cinerariifolium]